MRGDDGEGLVVGITGNASDFAVDIFNLGEIAVAVITKGIKRLTG